MWPLIQFDQEPEAGCGFSKSAREGRFNIIVVRDLTCAYSYGLRPTALGRFLPVATGRNRLGGASTKAEAISYHQSDGYLITEMPSVLHSPNRPASPDGR